MVILDTNLTIDIFNGYEPVKNGLKQFAKEELKITIFTKYEMLRGTTEENDARTRQFLDAFGLYEFSDSAMEETVGAYKKLETRGAIDEIDLLIFGISKAAGERMVTRDRNLGILGENVIVVKV